LGKIKQKGKSPHWLSDQHCILSFLRTQFYHNETRSIFQETFLRIKTRLFSTFFGNREHQEQIREYLGSRRFGEDAIPEIEKYVFDEA